MDSRTVELTASGRATILPPRGLLYSILAQVPMLALSWPPAPSRAGIAVGLVALAAGVALNLWADAVMRGAGVPVCPVGPTPRLLAGGPFRLTRNPMYLGFVLLSLVPVCISGVAANVFAPAALAMWLHYAFVLPEEAALRAGLGDAYVAYARRVPRWLLFTSAAAAATGRPGGAARRDPAVGPS